MDSGQGRLHLQWQLRRCAARAHGLLPHLECTGSFIYGYNVGAARRFPKYDTDQVSTLMCVLVWMSQCAHRQTDTVERLAK